MKIVFWNTARGKSDSVSNEAVEKILENCIALTNCRPEVLVLCEAQKGTRKTMRKRGGLHGYTLVKPSKFWGGDYRKSTTLRYVIFARDDVNCYAFYCETGKSRPAVHITANGFSFIAIHAPSVTSTVTPQVQALTKTLRNSMGLPEPALILGDFNVDGWNSSMRNRFVSGVSNGFLDYFGTDDLLPVFDPHHPTRPRSNKALDWVLVNRSFQRAVTVSVMRNKPKPKFDEYNYGRYDFDETYGEDEWVPKVKSTGKSDHEAIVIDIT